MDLTPRSFLAPCRVSTSKQRPRRLDFFDLFRTNHLKVEKLLAK
jgi:hypothetical protein